jgi:hypothetical protein
MTAPYVSPPLLRPLRTEAEARRQLGNMLGNMGKLSPTPTLADRQATRDDSVRRRLSRYAQCLRQELDALELSGRCLHEEERMSLTTALTAIRRALAAPMRAGE